MRYIKYAIAAMALTMTLSAQAQTTQRFSAGKINEYGLVYTLPTTVVDVTIEAEKTVETPGEYYQYAKKYLGINPIMAASTRWRLKNVIVTVRGESDPAQQYLVQFKSGSTPYMILNNQKFPLGINTEKNLTKEVSLPQAVAAKPTILETDAARQAVTEEMLQSQSSAKRAELAASRIYELRQSRGEIASGKADQMPSDGQAMKIAMSTLDSQEKALTAMFVGTKQVSTEVETFTVKLPADDEGRIVVARLSALDGIVDADNLSGDPIYLDVKVIERGKLPVNEKGEEKKFPKGGLAYCIPGRAQVSVWYDGRRLSDDEINVAQYGIVFGLDPNLFVDKKAPAYAVFDPTTGAIAEIGTVE